MQVKHVVITGGAGLIGSECIKKFKKNNFRITVIDNFCNTKLSRDSSIFEDINVKKQDIFDFLWEEIKEKIDIIVHLASPVGPAGILKHAGNIGTQILRGTEHVIRGAILHKCPLIFLSTSEVYGCRADLAPLKEDDKKIIGNNFTVRGEYSIGKLLSENIIYNTSKITDLRFQIIRPFNVCGPLQQEQGGFVLPRFIKQAIKGENLTVFGTGDQIRSFTHVADAVQGIYDLCHADRYNEIWNIGNKENTLTIFELAKKVKEVVGSASKIEFINPKTIYGDLYEEAYDKIPNTTKLEKEIIWKPKYSIEDIIRDFVNHLEL